jgi:hypothetical protein
MAKGKTPQKKNLGKKFQQPAKERQKKPKIEVLPPLPPLLQSPPPVSGQQNYLVRYLNSTMSDGTNVTEISQMQNEKYASQIIYRTLRSTRRDKILDIKASGNTQTFIRETKKYITDLCSDINALRAHSSMFIVLHMIEIGRFLEEIYVSLGNDRSKYAKWVKDNFENKHTRYFQMSRQLFKMGDVATKYSSLGKDRLLQADRLLKSEKYKEITIQHPPPDITEDRDGKGFQEHIDTAVTLHNLKHAGIDFVEFDQAFLLACYNKKWIEQKTATTIKKWLDRFPTLEVKKEAFDDYVMNIKKFPSDREYQVVGNLTSLNKILADLNSFYHTYIEPGQEEWKTSIDVNIFNESKNIMSTLTQVTLPERTVNTITENPLVAAPDVVKKKRLTKDKKKEVTE